MGLLSRLAKLKIDRASEIHTKLILRQASRGITNYPVCDLRSSTKVSTPRRTITKKNNNQENMRLNYVVLVIAIALLACIDTVSAAVNSKTSQLISSDSPPLVHSLTAGQNGVTEKRFLRRKETTDEDDSTELSADDEERAVLTGLAKVGTSISSKAEKLKFRFWRSIGTKPGTIYKRYNLGSTAVGSPKYKLWQRFYDWNKKKDWKRVSAS